MRKKVYYVILIIVLLAVFCFMYVLNYNTEFVTDDYIYQFVFEGRYPSPTTRLLSNPFQIFISMVNHWKFWGGRVTVHFLLQLAFLLGRNFFDFFNSLMFVLLGILIYLHINDKKKINIPLLITIYATVFLFVPQPGSTIFWKSGSANYLWSSVLILIMTFIFKEHFDNEDKIKNNRKNSILLLIYGLLVGCANENSGCALIVSIILFIILFKIKYNKIPRWSFYALGGTIFSYILLLISPGNYIRADEMYPDVKYGLVNLIDYVLKITKLTNKFVGIILIIAVLTFIIILKKKKNVKEFITEYGIQIIFFSFTFISIYSLVLSPAYPERCWMFAFVYLIILIGLNLSYLEKGKYKIYILKLYFFLMFSLSLNAISTYSDAYYDIVDTKNCVNYHKSQIKEQLKKGITDVSVHSFPNSTGKYNAFSYNGYLSYNPESWTNRWVAEYYGASSIVVEEVA